MFMYAVQIIIGIYDRFAERIFKLVMIKPQLNMFVFAAVILALSLLHIWMYTNLYKIVDSDSFQAILTFHVIALLFVVLPVFGLVMYKFHKSYTEPAIIEFYGPQSLSDPFRVHRSSLQNKPKSRKPSDDEGEA